MIDLKFFNLLYKIYILQSRWLCETAKKGDMRKRAEISILLITRLQHNVCFLWRFDNVTS